MKLQRFIPLVTAFATGASANGGGYHLEGVKSTGPFRPVNVDSVQMVSEKLDIELRKDAAVINLTYVFHNPGKALTVEMGFPCAGVVEETPARDGKPAVRTDLPALQEFHLEADGKPVKAAPAKDHAKLPAEEGEGEHGPGFSRNYRVVTGWQVVKLPFESAQTRLVKVSYLNPYFRRGYGVEGSSDTDAPALRYLFSAAGLWSGPIKTGEVTIRATGIDPDVVRLSHPKRFKRDGKTWTWSFTDFEPTLQDDLEIIAGEYIYSQSWYSNDGRQEGSYTVRGSSGDFKELQKHGKWTFTGRRYTAKASSTLKADQDHTYGAENLTDRDSGKVWAEGAEGDGIGESVTLTMKDPQKGLSLTIHNGHLGSQELFLANNRVKSMAVSLNGGTPFTVELKDGYRQPTTVAIPGDTGVLKTVKLTIQSVYPGKSFRDTCLTGVDVEVSLSKAPVISQSR